MLPQREVVYAGKKRLHSEAFTAGHHVSFTIFSEPNCLAAAKHRLMQIIDSLLTQYTMMTYDSMDMATRTKQRQRLSDIIETMADTHFFFHLSNPDLAHDMRVALAKVTVTLYECAFAFTAEQRHFDMIKDIYQDIGAAINTALPQKASINRINQYIKKCMTIQPQPFFHQVLQGYFKKLSAFCTLAENILLLNHAASRITLEVLKIPAPETTKMQVY